MVSEGGSRFHAGVQAYGLLFKLCYKALMVHVRHKVLYNVRCTVSYALVLLHIALRHGVDAIIKLWLSDREEYAFNAASALQGVKMSGRLSHLQQTSALYTPC